MFDEMFRALKELIDEIIKPEFPKGSEHGASPPQNAITITWAYGRETRVFFDYGGLGIHTLVVNGKHQDGKMLVEVLSRIHYRLSQMSPEELPHTDKWEITSIRSYALPNFIEQEQSTRAWLYGSSINVHYYMEGEKCRA